MRFQRKVRSVWASLVIESVFFCHPICQVSMSVIDYYRSVSPPLLTFVDDNGIVEFIEVFNRYKKVVLIFEVVR